jgi:hypothetical protein
MAGLRQGRHPGGKSWVNAGWGAEMLRSRSGLAASRRKRGMGGILHRRQALPARPGSAENCYKKCLAPPF